MRVTLLILMLLLSIAVSTQAASIDIIQKGVSGSLSSDIVLENLTGSNTSDNNVFFGTQLGIYVFSSEGDLINFIQTGSTVTNIVSIPDINGNNNDELVFTTTNVYFPNILCYDSYSSEKLWEFSSETEVFDVAMLWTMKQVAAYGLTTTSLGDKIYLTAGYNVYCLDSSNGQKLASYEGTDNMWDIILVDGDVVVGDQNGYLYHFDSSLSLVWKVLISKSVTVVNPSTKEERGTVKRSVWDIASITVNNQKVIAAGCEDGNLYTINFETGSILKSLEIIDYVDDLLYAYYGDNPIPTTSVDYNFFNIRLSVIPDISADGDEDLLVYTYPGFRFGTEYQGAIGGIYVIDSSDCSIDAQNENFDLTKITKLETITSQTLEDNTFILLPTGKSGSLEKIKLVSIEDLEIYKTVSINSTSGSSGQSIYSIKSLENDYFILCSSTGDVLKCNLSGNIFWNYPRLNNLKIDRVDLVRNSELDLLVKSSEGMEEDSFLEVTNSRTIFVVDGETKEIAWSYEMVYDEYLESGGLLGVKVVDDINNDGKKDIIGYKQWQAEWGRGDEYGTNTRLIAFSGDGTILYEKPLTNDTFYSIYESYAKDPTYLATLDENGMNELNNHRIRKTIISLDSISDVNGDNVSDFVVGSWNDVHIIDAVTGEIFWTRTYNSGLYEHPDGYNPMSNYEWSWAENDRMLYYSLGDHNADGYDELLQVSWNDMNILRSQSTGSSFDYSIYEQIVYEDGNFEREKIKIVDDLNGDDFKDIIFRMHIEDSPSIYKCLDGVDGTEIMEIVQDGTTIDLGVADFNGDSYDDNIVFYSWGSSGPRLEVKSGSDSEVIWNYQKFEETWALRDFFSIRNIMPACYVDDINGDGIRDLALGRSLPWDSGADILVYDVKNNNLLKTITVEAIDQSSDSGERRWQPSVITAPLSDLTNDGIGEVAVVMALGKGSQKQLKLVIVDIMEEELISDFAAKGTQIEDFGSVIATYGSGGELYLLNPEKNLTIMSPKKGQKVGSPIKVTWDEGNTESVKIIMVDNNRILKTLDQEVEFDLKAGSRKITIYSFDKYGKGLYTSVDVNIEKSSGSEIPLTVAFIFLLFVLIIPKLLPIVKKKQPKSAKQKVIKEEEDEE